MIRRLSLLPVLLLAPLLALAELAVPALQARVTDLSGTLDAAQVAALEAKLAAFEQRKGAQVAVLLVASTQPEAIEQYGIRVAGAWQLGRRGVDDGALLLVARDDRSLRIEVGYGLEGVLPDAIARRIIDEAIVPRFRDGDYYGGIDAGIDRMLAVIDGEPLPAPPRQQAADAFDELMALLPLLFIFTFVFGTAFKRSLGQLPGSLTAGALIGGLAWLILGVAMWAWLAAAAAFLLTLFSRTATGGWASRGGSGMGGASGGRGGGSFRGGGGGFGGGGSSGRW